MLQQAGIKAPAKSWDELVEHSLKLKKDKVSDYPFLPNWNVSPSGTMPQFMTDSFSEGATVFDGQEQGHRGPGARGRARHGTLAESLEGRAGQSGGVDQDLLDRHAPPLLDRPVRVSHEPLVLLEDDRGRARELRSSRRRKPR